MADEDLREGEMRVDVPPRADASLRFIGRIRTPFATRRDCPRQGDPIEGPTCRIEIDADWRLALQGIGANSHLQVLYWLDGARRDLGVQTPRGAEPKGTFALRSPNRPNPIASSIVALVATNDDHLIVRGLDCVDGTPLLDLKPERCPHGAPPS